MLRCARDNPWFVIAETFVTPVLGGALSFVGAGILTAADSNYFGQASLEDYFLRGLISTTASMITLKIILNMRRDSDASNEDSETLFTSKVRLALSLILSLGMTGLCQLWRDSDYTRRMSAAYALGFAVALAGVKISKAASVFIAHFFCKSSGYDQNYHGTSVVSPLALTSPISREARGSLAHHSVRVAPSPMASVPTSVTVSRSTSDPEIAPEIVLDVLDPTSVQISMESNQVSTCFEASIRTHIPHHPAFPA